MEGYDLSTYDVYGLRELFEQNSNNRTLVLCIVDTLKKRSRSRERIHVKGTPYHDLYRDCILQSLNFFIEDVCEIYGIDTVGSRLHLDYNGDVNRTTPNSSGNTLLKAFRDLQHAKFIVEEKYKDLRSNFAVEDGSRVTFINDLGDTRTWTVSQESPEPGETFIQNAIGKIPGEQVNYRWWVQSLVKINDRNERISVFVEFPNGIPRQQSD